MTFKIYMYNIYSVYLMLNSKKILILILIDNAKPTLHNLLK